MKEVLITSAVILTDGAVDQETFLAHYDQLFPRVYTYFRCRCEDTQICDDLTAQAFEQALSHLDQFDPQRGAFTAWLFGIARNLANAHLRRTQRFSWLPLDLFGWMTDPTPSPEEVAMISSRRQALLSGIRSLSTRQRDLLGLKFFAGLNNRQIAAMTGLSEANVAAILHRSIRQLRLKVSQEDPE